MESNEQDLDLQPAEAMALTRLTQRLSWQVVRSLAADETDCREMLYAANKLREGLTKAGYAQR